MPKEIIYDEASMYDVQVAWARDKYVQVGIETSNGTPIADRLYEEPQFNANIRSEKQLIEIRKERRERFDNIALAQFTGLWGTLDREGCNRLIRVLRRARD